MGGVVKWIVAALAAVVVAISFLIVRATVNAGEWTTLVPIFDGECVRLEGFVGAEDLALDPETRTVYAAGVDRRAAADDPAVRGAVWAIPLAAPENAEPLDLTEGAPAIFKPLGIDLHVGADGVRRLFVVNRRGGGDHVVEVYRVEGERLAHEGTLADPLFRNLNDLAAVGPDAFYFTIDKATETGSFAEIVEGVLQRRTGKIGVYDGAGARLVDEGLQYANGVALSPDGASVYVAETVGRALRIYDRAPDTNALSLRDRVFLGTGVDNITVDAEGRLFIAAHPKLLTFALGHAEDPAKRAPSQVILVEPDARIVDQVYMSLGEDLSAASAAVVDVAAHRMLIGAIYEPHILSCRLPEVWRHSQSHPARRPVGRDAIGEE